MAEWLWEARARDGETRKGTMEAKTADMVEQRLRSQNLQPVKVKKKPREFNIQIGSPVSEDELVIFVRQFATMIDAGLPLVQCLDILGNQPDGNKAFNRILQDIKSFVEQGGTFSEGLARHPKIFDNLFVNLVRAGEEGGILDTIFQRLAVYIEKRVKLKRQVRSALIYPTAVIFVAIALIGVMMTVVIPSFKGMFAEFGAEDELPGLTQFVVNASNFTVSNLHWIVLLIFLVTTGVAYSFRLPGGKRFWHTVFLKAPVLGPVMRKIAVSRFTRTLGTLLSSGVPILDSMNIVSRASGNVIVEEAINDVTEGIKEGKTMSAPLMETGVFPPMVVQMISVGEETGALDTMLNKIADFYEDEVDVAVAGLTSLLEPIIMVVIGGVVAVILIAMYLPIFDIAGKIQT